jgi:hypothetical protein
MVVEVAVPDNELDSTRPSRKPLISMIVGIARQ